MINSNLLHDEFVQYAIKMKRTKKIEILVSIITYLMLFFNMFLVIPMNYFNRTFTDWSYAIWLFEIIALGIMVMFDSIVVILTFIWVKIFHSKYDNDIHIPFNSKKLDKTIAIVNFVTMFLTAYDICMWIFYHGSWYEHNLFMFFTSLQIFLTFTYWNWFMYFLKNISNTKYMKNIEQISKFNFRDVEEYNTILKKKIYFWIDKYNTLIKLRANKANIFKRILLIIFKFDFKNKSWQDKIIKDDDILSHQQLNAILNEKNVVSSADACMYKFCLLVYIFRQIYSKEDPENKFKLYYWLREKKAVADFEAKILTLKIKDM